MTEPRVNSGTSAKGDGAGGEGSFWSTVRADLERAADPATLRWSVIVRLMLNAGFRAVLLYRVQAVAQRHNWIPAVVLVRTVNVMLHGADFVEGCQIGPGLLIRHPVGIVVGAGVKIGKCCTVLQGVTFGETLGAQTGAGGYPTVGDHVTVCANAVVIGSITIGSNVLVGANSLVRSDVRSDCTVGGVPAVEIGL